MFIGGLIVLALTAALVVPYFIDWSSYRADFEREASAVLGRKVTVQGEATARLLPFPSVTFSDVAVGGLADGKPAMTIETFSMDAELAPLMRGEVLIFDMRMVRPKAVIEMAADGAVDWTMRPSSPFDARRISLEKLTVTEGQIDISDAASGRTHHLADIDMVVSARSFAGPWRADGALSIDGMPSGLSVSTGTVDETGQMRLRLKADPQALDATVETDGNIRVDKGALFYAGQFKIIGDDAESESLRGGEGEKVEPGALKGAPGYRLNGLFSADSKKLAIDEFRFETGPLDNPYTADGKALVELGAAPRFSIEANGAQVRFDEAVVGGPEAGLTLGQRLAALEQALVALPKPAIPGTIDVNLPAIVVGDTTIRDVRLASEPADGGWTIKSFAATLPGRTRLEADGLLRTAGEFGFSGSLLLAVGQPSGFAAWISKDVDEAIRRMPAAGFSAKVDMTAQRQTFGDLELVLGNAKFRGTIDSSQPPNLRPSMLLKLEGEALDVDGLTAFASLFVSDQGANRFSNSDVDFQIKAGPVTAGALTADTIDTALRLRDGLLEIDRLAIGGLAGASISATGAIKNFDKNPTGNLDASVVAVDLAPLIRLAAAHYPDNALLAGLDRRAAAYSGLFADARINVVASAAANDDGSTGVAFSVEGDAGGSTITGTLSGNGKRGALASASLSTNFSARNGDATALLGLLGLPVVPLGQIGAGELNFSAKGALATGVATDLSLTADNFVAKFAGTTSLGGQGAAAKGKVQLETTDLEPWLMTSAISLPGMGMGMPVALSADADYANGLLVLGGIFGTVNENSISGDVNAEIKDGIPHLTGSVALDALDLDPVAAMVLGENAVISDDGGWSSVPFQQKTATPFTAEVDISANAVSAGSVASAYDVTLGMKLDAEGLRVSDIKGKLFGGDLAGLFELKNTAGTGLFSGQMKVTGADLGQALTGSGLIGSGDVSTQLSGSGKSVEGMIAALSGSGTATLGGLVIPGINPQAFPTMIAFADAVGRDIDAARTASFAPAIAGDGDFAATGAADVAFTVASGILRAPPIALDNRAATLTSDVRADFNTGRVAAAGSIAYRPGDEALVGSEPVMRFGLEGPVETAKIAFDSQELAQFLTQRALEREQARVEALQAALLEKQRLRREVRYYAALEEERDRTAEALRQALEQARLEAETKARLEAEAKAKADEEARLAAEAEAVRAAEALARQGAEEDKQRTATEAKRRKDEAASKAAAEEQARREAARRAADPAPENVPIPEPRADKPEGTPPPAEGIGKFFRFLQ